MTIDVEGAQPSIVLNGRPQGQLATLAQAAHDDGPRLGALAIAEFEGEQFLALRRRRFTTH